MDGGGTGLAGGGEGRAPLPGAAGRAPSILLKTRGGAFPLIQFQGCGGPWCLTALLPTTHQWLTSPVAAAAAPVRTVGRLELPGLAELRPPGRRGRPSLNTPRALPPFRARQRGHPTPPPPQRTAAQWSPPAPPERAPTNVLNVPSAWPRPCRLDIRSAPSAKASML